MRYNVYSRFLLPLVLVIGFLAALPTANASHGVGADIRFTCLGGNTYQFELTFFRDCAGITPTTPTLNIAGCGVTGTITMTQIGAPINLPGICPGASTCDTPAGTSPGVQQYIYRGTYTLPSACADWTVSFGQCCRNNAVSNLAGASGFDLYTEAHLNNLNVNCDNSPDFTALPVAYMCAGQPFTYNFGTVDADGDEVTYALAQPLSAGVAIGFSGTFTAAQPMCSIPANSMVLNPQTGQMSITPCANQQAVLDVVATEWRIINGVRTMIGSVRRDIQVIVVSCGTNSLPAIAAPTNVVPAASYTAVNNSGIFRICPGTALSFQVQVSDANATDVITATAVNLPVGATVTQTGSNPKTLTFSWTPTASAVGQHNVSFQVNDNFCPIRGTANEGYTIIVQGVSVSASRATMCYGTPTVVSLTALATTVAGGTYTWSSNPAVTFSPAGSSQTVTATVTRPTTFTVRYNDNICNATDTSVVQAYGPVSAVPATASYCPTDPALQLGASYNNPAPPPTAACTTGTTTQCTGAQSNKTIGTGAGNTSTTGSIGTPFQGFWHDGRFQMLFTPSELSAAGVSPGLITRLGLNVTTKASTIPYSNFNIKMGCVSATSLSAFFGGLTTVYTNAAYTTVVGTNTFTFTSPYRWDGVSSLVIEICFDNTSFTGYDNVSFTATASNTVVYQRVDGSTGCTLASATVSTNRPDVILRNCPIVVPPAGVTYSWTVSPASLGTVSNPAIANPTATTIGTPTVGTIINYIVQGTDGTCTSRDTVAVTIAPCNACTANASIASPASTELTCTRTSIQLDAAGPSTGSGTLAYLWSTNATGGIQGSATAGITTASQPGTYTVVVTNTDASAIPSICTSSASITVTRNTSVPVLTLTSNVTTLTCATPTATLTAATTPSGAYNYTYNVTGLSGAINTGVGAGSYSVTVTNTDNGCTTTSGVVTINQTNQLPNVPASPTGLQLTCTNLATGGISITTFINSTPVGVDFQWSGMPATPPTPNPWIQPAFTVTAAGTYTVTVTNTANGCSVTRQVLVSIDTLRPAATLAANRTILTCTNPTATLTAQPSGVNYFFNWSSVASSAANTATVNAANTYTVTVTSNQNGCTKSATIAITANTATPVVDILPPSTLNCLNATTGIVLDATGSSPGTTGGTVNYAWSGGGTSGTKTVTTVGPWTVTVTDATNGCTSTGSVTVPQDLTPATPTITASAPALTCSVTSIVLTATGGGTYVWSGGGTTATKTVSTAGTYTVTVTHQFTGCTGTASFVVTQNTTAPIVTITAPQVLTCSILSTSVTAGGGTSYAWSAGANPLNAATTTLSAIGTYTVTVTSSTNGCSATGTVTVTNLLTQPATAITTTPANTTELTCARQSITLTATGGDSYTWGAGQNTATLTASTATTYTVTATLTSTGCTKTASIIITQNITPPIPSVTSNIPSNTLTCTTQSGTLTAAGGGTYRWDDATTVNPRTIAAPGTYTVTVTATANGCTASSTIVITRNTTAPVVTIAQPAVITCLAPNTTLTAAGATTYVWDNASTANPRTVSAIGTYTVTGTSSTNGCTATATTIVTNNIVPPVVAITANPDTSLNCLRTQVSLIANGGDSYVWVNTVFSSTGPVANITQPGTYTVTATSATTGCTASATKVVTRDLTPPPLNLIMSDTNITCTVSAITATASGGNSYVWSIPNTAGQSTVTITSGGTYTVTATNTLNGCTASSQQVVTQDNLAPLPVITADTNRISCTLPTATLTSSGLGNDTFVWSSLSGSGIVSSNNNSAIVNAGDTYQVLVTSLTNGCTATAVFAITQDIAPPSPSILVPVALNCANLHTTTLTAQGGDTYIWQGPGIVSQTNAVATVNQIGTYTVVATNSLNGCTASTTQTVVEDLTAPAPTIAVGGAVTCTNPTTTLTVTGGDTYVWSPNAASATTPTVTVQNSGVYTVTATSAATGCTATATATVLQNTTAPTLTITANRTTVNCTNTTATLTANSNPTYTYLWSANAGSSTNASVVVGGGTYQVSVTNPANGCLSTAQQVVVADFTAPLPTITASAPQLTCAITSINLTAAGGDTFSWGTSTNPVLTITTPSIYIVTATTTSNGCTGTASMAITQDISVPILSVNQPATMTCASPLVTLTAIATANASVDYLWSNTGIGAATTITRLDVVGASGSTFTVTATNTVNGCLASASVTIPVDTVAPVVSVVTPPVLTCTTQNITLVGAGTDNYVWSSPATATGVTSLPGIYTVTGTSASNGCSATATTTVLQDLSVAAPTTLTADVTTLNCQTLTANLTATGGDSYSWNGVVSFNGNTAVVNAPNTYVVTITKAATGCTTTNSIVIVQDITQPTVTIVPSVSVLTCAQPISTLTANTTPVSCNYAWSTNTSATNTIVVNAPDNYTVTVTNPANFCTQTASVAITQDIAVPVITVSQPTVLTCNDPTTVVSVAPATGLTFIWSGSSPDIIASGSTAQIGVANTYTVTATSVANGCSATAPVFVIEDKTPPLPQITANPFTATLTCAQTQITLTAAGGINCQWSPNSPVLNQCTTSVTQPDTYTVQVTNATNGCTATTSIVVDSDVVVPTIILQSDVNTLDCRTLVANLSASGADVYAWSNGVFVDGPGAGHVVTGSTYTVTAVQNSNGCSSMASINIAQDLSAPQVQLAADFLQLTCTNPISTITATTNPVIGVTFTWGGLIGQNTVSVSVPNTYQVTVEQNTTGCTTVASIDITQDISQPQISIATPALLTCGVTSVSLVASADVPALFAWDANGAGNPYTVTAPSNYVVTATSVANGCTNTGVTSVLQDIVPPVPVITQTNNGTITCTNPTLQLTATGGTPNWGPLLGTNATVTVSAANTYTVTVQNPSNGCTASTQSVVSANLLTPIPTITASNLQITCAVTSITLSVNGAGTNDAIEWSTNEVVPTITITSGGVYTVKITRADNGCSAITSFTVGQDVALPVMTLTSNVPIITCAQPTATLLATGGDTYVWAASGTGLVAANGGTALINAGGTYSVTATNQANGCTNMQTITIGEDKVAPIAAIDQPGTLTCATTTITLTASGGDLYTWSNNVQSSAGATAVVSNSTNYTVTVTNSANGCKSTAAVTVGQDVVTPTVSASLDLPLNCSHPVTTMTATGGNQYAWSSNVSSTNGATAQTLSPGTFTVTVTSLSNGCTASATIVVVQDIVPPVPSLTANFTILNCSNPSATLQANGGAAYAWSINVGSSANDQATVAASNIYTVTVTSPSNGCTASATIFIDRDFEIPNLQATISNVSCNGGLTGGIDLSVTNATNPSYNWSSASITEDLASISEGQYCVTVTGGNGCSQSACYIIEQSAAITGTFDVVDARCHGSATGSLNAIPAGGSNQYTYNWSNGGTTQRIIGLVAGTYTVTISDTNGCQGTATATVGEPVAIQVTANQTAPVKCKGASNGQATVAALGGILPYQILWDSREDSTLAVMLAVGVHTVTVTDANQCSVTATVTITEPAQTVASILTTTDATCYNTATGSIQAGIAGGTSPYTFSWSDGFVSGGATSTHLNLVVGTYFVTVTDINGCTASASASIGQPSAVFVAATGITPTQCAYSADAHATGVAAGGTPAAGNVYSYRWDSGELSNPAVTLNKGTHSVTATDANGCTASTTFIVLGPDPISLNTKQQTDVTCNGLTNGTATIALLGGTPNYTYAWSSGSVTNTQTNMAAGNYTVSISDANGCTMSPIHITITEPTPLVINNMTPFDPVCNAGSTGKIIAVAGGGTTPYSYNWSTGAFGSPIINLVAGTYAVTATDAHGCTVASATTINEPSAVVASATVTNAKCFNDRNGGLTINAPVGGTPPYVYSLDGISFTTTNYFTNLPANTYSYHVQDANGCEFTEPFTITSNPPIQVSVGDDIIIPLGESTQLQAVIEAGVNAFTTAWTNPSTLSDPTVTAPIATPTSTVLYTVVVTDSEGCHASDDILVSIDKHRNIYVPTAFSPNGDGVNDYFSIYGGVDVAKIKRFMVFDRLGEMVYDAKDFFPNDPRHGWDGKLREETMNTSVFVYYLQVEFKDGAVEEFKGDVTLVK